MSNIKVDDQWKTPTSVYVKVGGAWKIAAQTYSKIDGVWKETTLSSPPAQPVLQWISGETFRIVEYNSSLVYQATLVSGSGTPSLNTSTGIYTISSSGAYYFNVTASYAVGALVSIPGFMEKKLRSFSSRDVTYDEPYACDCFLDAGCGGCRSGPGQCSPGQSQSFGQCGCPGWMCWDYYNGVVCGTCTRPACCIPVFDVLIDEPGYTYNGTSWYRAG
jgi:hypothetical protein